MNIVQRGLQVLLLALGFILIGLLLYGLFNILIYIVLCMLLMAVLWRIPIVRKWVLDRVANSAYARFYPDMSPEGTTKNADSDDEQDITEETKRLKVDAE